MTKNRQKNGSVNRDLLNFLYSYGIFWMPVCLTSLPMPRSKSRAQFGAIRRHIVFEQPETVSINSKNSAKGSKHAFYIIKMQLFPKTKGFCKQRGLFRKNSLFSIKTTYAFLEKNSNPEYILFEKNRFSEKIETPASVSIMLFGSCHLSCHLMLFVNSTK